VTDLSALHGKLAALEAERVRLTQAPPERGARRRAIKEDKALTAALADAERRVRELEARRDALMRGGAPARPFVVTWVPRLIRLAAGCILGAGVTLGGTLLRARDAVRWVETTCAAVPTFGDDDPMVTPARRPEWRFPHASSAPCWVPAPPTLRPLVRFAEPKDPRVSRMDQVPGDARALAILFLVLAGILGTSAYALSKGPVPAVDAPKRKKRKSKRG
jgi:hypothetical protein